MGLGGLPSNARKDSATKNNDQLRSSPPRTPRSYRIASVELAADDWHGVSPQSSRMSYDRTAIRWVG
jgi:hypothetical protein